MAILRVTAGESSVRFVLKDGSQYSVSVSGKLPGALEGKLFDMDSLSSKSAGTILNYIKGQSESGYTATQVA